MNAVEVVCVTLVFTYMGIFIGSSLVELYRDYKDKTEE